MRLHPESIVMHESAQPRVELDWVTIMSYADDMKAGDVFPPVVVFYDGCTYWLADGFHRVRAALEAGLSEITADVRGGELKDARWYSYTANQKQGLRRSNADKRRAALGAIKDWHLVHGTEPINYREIARMVGVDHKTVATLHGEILRNWGISPIAPTVTNNGADPDQAEAAVQQDLDFELVLSDEAMGALAERVSAIIATGQSPLVVDPIEIKDEELERTGEISTDEVTPFLDDDEDEEAYEAESSIENIAEQELWEEGQILTQSADRVLVIDPFLADIPTLLAAIERLQEYVVRKENAT